MIPAPPRLPGVRLVGEVYLNEDGSFYSVPVAQWPSGHVMYRWLNRASEKPMFDLLRKGGVQPDDVKRNSLLGLRHDINATEVDQGWYPRDLSPVSSMPSDPSAPGEARWFLEQLGLALVPRKHAMMAVIEVYLEVAASEPLPGQLLEVDPVELEAYLLLGDRHPLLWPTSRFAQWAQERWL